MVRATSLFCLVLIAGSLSWNTYRIAQQSPVSLSAIALQNSAIVIDTHDDTPQRFLDDNYDIGSTDAADPDFISLDKASAGNLSAIFRKPTNATQRLEFAIVDSRLMRFVL